MNLRNEYLLAWVTVVAAWLAGCQHKAELPTPNLKNLDQIAQRLQRGMTYAQVRGALGPANVEGPEVVPKFGSHKKAAAWSYFQGSGEDPFPRELTVLFGDGKVTRWKVSSPAQTPTSPGP